MILTGIKPTGVFHIGNYMSTIMPILNMKDKCYIFIADMHSMTKFQKPEELSQNIRHIYAVLMSYFHNFENIKIYRQSQIPEIFELYYILNCFCVKGLLNRNHTYKVAVEQNIEQGRDEDHAVNMGLFTYPTLMAADILIFNPDFVPVGIDQEQHMEITRIIAKKINFTYKKDVFKIPQSIHQKEATLIGTDGRKMSKSYNNVIPLFYDDKKLKKLIFSIATNSKNVNESKYEGESVISEIYKFLSTKEQYQELINDMKNGIGWGEVKQRTYDLIKKLSQNQTESYHTFFNSNFNEKLINNELELRKIASSNLQKIKDVMGVL